MASNASPPSSTTARIPQNAVCSGRRARASTNAQTANSAPHSQKAYSILSIAHLSRKPALHQHDTDGVDDERGDRRRHRPDRDRLRIELDLVLREESLD